MNIMSGKRMLVFVLALLLILTDIAALAEIQYYAKLKETATVYKKADKASDSLGKVKADTFVLMSDAGNGWAKIQLDGKTGYVKTGQLTKRAKALYVTAGSVVMYKKADTGSTKLATIPYGAKVSAYYTQNGWTNMIYGSSEGWCKSSALSLKDPNTLNKTVYIQAESGKVYETPSTSAASASVSGTTALTCTALYNNEWYRVTYKSKVGFVKKSAVGASKYAASSTAKSSSSSSSSASSSKSASSASATMYVSAASMAVYKSADSNSTKLATLAYGAKVTTNGSENGWTKVKSGSQTGYCKSASLTSTNPNTLNKTVYPQKNKITVYSTPNESSTTKTVSYTTKLTCTASYGDFYRVTNSGNVGFVKKSDVDTKKYDGYSTSSPAAGHSKSADWFTSNINYIFYRGAVATVTDVKTGISWKVKRKGGYNHADVEPLTAADTAAMKKACGSDFQTWHRRAIWVSINGVKYAASMNCMNHGECNIKNNNFDGHHCIHFTNSRTHSSDKLDDDHQACIKRALAAG